VAVEALEKRTKSRRQNIHILVVVIRVALFLSFSVCMSNSYRFFLIHDTSKYL